MIDNVNCQLNEKNEPQQGEPLSHPSYVELDESSAPAKNCARLQFRSRSLDHLQLRRQRSNDDDDDHVSNTTRTEMDLTGIGCHAADVDPDQSRSKTNEEYDLQPQRSQSAPVSPTQFYDKELASFIQCEQQQQQMMADSFVYNIDLSDANETGTHQTHSRAAIFFEDDDDDDDEQHSFDDIPYDPVVNIVHSCLPITEENEEELEQLQRDAEEEQEEEEEKKRNHLLKINDGSIPTVTLHDNDDRADILENDDDQISESEAQILIMNTSSHFDPNQDIEKRLSTIYESPSPQPRTEEEEEEREDDEDDIYDEAYDRLIVYDIANVEKPSTISPKSEVIKSPCLSYRSPILDRTRIRSCYTDASFKPCPTFTNPISASRLCGTSSVVNSKVFTPPFLQPHDKSSPSPVTINTHNNYINKSLASLPTEQQSPSKSTPMSLSVPILLLPSISGEQSPCPTDHQKLMPSQHIKTMKVMVSTSSSLSDFIIPTPVSTFNNTTHYEEVSSVHHSLTDCSSVPHISCGTSTLEGEASTTSKSCEDNQRRPSFTRRILTNGLLLSHCSTHHAYQRRAQPPLTFNQHRQQTKPKSEEKLSTLSSPIGSSSSSSESSSPAGEKFMSRSDFILQQQQQQQQQNISQQRKASSLKTISATAAQQPSKILYPIDFESNNNEDSWYQKQSSSNAAHQNKVPTSDSGIVIDTMVTRPTSNASIEDNEADGIPLDITNSGKLKQYESNYRQALADLTHIKKNIVEIESRLSEAMRELEIERALVEGEHELVFKQILDDSETDQEKIRHLYNDLQLLTERVMTEKSSIRNEIEYTQQVLYKLEYELRELEVQYRPTDDKIVKKRELLAETRRKHEDLEFQYMELETRCETELEQAEEQFQREQILVAQNSKLRQNTLRDLDHQQNIILHQVIIEKEKLEREKQKLKLLFKQKKLEASELQQRLNGILIHPEKKIYENTQQLHSKDAWSNGSGTMYHSSPSNLYSTLNYADNSSSAKISLKDSHQEKLDEIKEMIAVAKLEKMTILEQQLRERYDELVHCHDEHLKRVELEQKLASEIQNRDYLIERQVKLREKNRMQERPLTRYLPIRSVDFDLRAHIEGAGHLLDSSHIHITSTSCRGFLLKMGGMKFKTWNRRWFVFDRKRRSLFYYQDKTETKLRGCIYFQSIVEVYVDHLQSISLRSPEPREATFIVKTIERPYYLVAPTVEAMRIWVDVIITGAEGNTFAGES